MLACLQLAEGAFLCVCTVLCAIYGSDVLKLKTFLKRNASNWINLNLNLNGKSLRFHLNRIKCFEMSTFWWKCYWQRDFINYIDPTTISGTFWLQIKGHKLLHTYAYGYAYVLVAATHSCQHWKCRIYYGVFKCYAMKLKLSRANGRKSILTCCTNFGYSHKMCRSRSMFVCIVYIRACVNRCACLFSVKRNLWKFA